MTEESKSTTIVAPLLKGLFFFVFSIFSEFSFNGKVLVLEKELDKLDMDFNHNIPYNLLNDIEPVNW